MEWYWEYLRWALFLETSFPSDLGARRGASFGCLLPACPGNTCAPPSLSSEVSFPMGLLCLPRLSWSWTSISVIFCYLMNHPKLRAYVSNDHYFSRNWVRSLAVSSGVPHTAAFTWELDRGWDWPRVVHTGLPGSWASSKSRKGKLPGPWRNRPGIGPVPFTLHSSGQSKPEICSDSRWGLIACWRSHLGCSRWEWAAERYLVAGLIDGWRESFWPHWWMKGGRSLQLLRPGGEQPVTAHCFGLREAAGSGLAPSALRLMSAVPQRCHQRMEGVGGGGVGSSRLPKSWSKYIFSQ